MPAHDDARRGTGVSGLGLPSGPARPPHQSLEADHTVTNEPDPVSPAAGLLTVRVAEIANGVAYLADGLLEVYDGTAANLVRRAAGLAGRLLDSVGGFLLGGNGEQGPLDGPHAPRAPPAPAAPPPVPPATTVFAGGSQAGQSDEDDDGSPSKVFGVLETSSISFAEGGTSWSYWEPPKPGSALQLVVERPG